MTETPETIRLLMAAIERIDTKLEALDGKLERKIDLLNQKLDVNLRSFQEEIQDLREDYTKLEAECRAKGCLGGALGRDLDAITTKMKKLQDEVDSLRNTEWKIFFRQVGKVAAYIVGVGTAIVLLQQIFGFGRFYGIVSTNTQTAPASPTPLPKPNP